MTDLLLILVLIGLVVLIVLSFRRKDDSNENLQQQLNNLTQTLDSKMSESNRAIADQFKYSAGIIKDVTAELTKIKETNRQVMGFADQLQSLENVLKNTKQRGILGEYYLEEVLKNVFAPSQYQMQYKFLNGDIVDAVIFVEDGKIIPIDSKFSLENYNKIIEEEDENKKKEYEKMFRIDLKKRIDETSKYIKPNEGTFDFAFMFIPSEAIYYDLLVNKVGSMKSSTRDLIDYAIRDRHVHIVSPTSFYAYLQTVAIGFKFLQVEKSTKVIIKNVDNLKRHLNAYEEHFTKVGNHLGTTVNAYNSASSDFLKLDKDITKITGSSPELEINKLNKPE